MTNDHTFQWVDSLAWSHGKHSFKFGAEIRRDQYNEAGNPDLRGQFTVNGQATGYEFADYMLGYIGQLQDAATLGVAQFRATSQAYYVDDSWKVRPNLTLNLGIRYEYDQPWYEVNNKTANVLLDSGVVEYAGSVPAGAPVGSITCPTRSTAISISGSSPAR